MNLRTRRYLFTAYSDIETLDFEHLEKVCDRLFVMIPEHTASIPFSLVRRLQRMGRGVKWIPVGDTDGVSLSVQLSFLMGRLHQKLPFDIEFAILSDETAFDSLVQFILSKDRSCLRVRVSRIVETWDKNPPLNKNNQHHPNPEIEVPLSAPTVPPILLTPSKASASIINAEIDHSKVRFTPAEQMPDETTLRNTAQDVIERLVRSGNRPAEVNTLKQYISLTNQTVQPNVAEKVIALMAMNNDIQIVDKEVVYNF